MNRRDFLVRMIGGAAAALVLPQLELIAKALPAEAEAMAGAAWTGTFGAVLHEAVGLYRRAMEAYGLPVLSAHVQPRGDDLYGQHIGQLAPDGVLYTDQCSVMVDRDELDRAILPAVQALADRAAYYGVDRYGALALPMGVEYAGQEGPLRLIAQYDIGFEMLRMWLDVLGGASELGKRVTRRRMQGALAARIKAGRTAGESVHKRISAWSL